MLGQRRELDGPQGRSPALVSTWTVLNRGLRADASARLRTAWTAAIVIGAGTVAGSAIIHLHLWFQGYRHIHLIGPLFLAQGVSGIALAIAMVAYRRLVTVLAGALYQAATVAGLLLSATVGIFGFHDGLGVPWATSSLLIEVFGFVVLASAGAAVAVRQ